MSVVWECRDNERAKDITLSGQDIVIAVMGVTGAGKTTFISLLTEVEVGVGLNQCQTDVRVYFFEYQSLRVFFLDTPGFDDCARTDSERLKDITFWLANAYIRGIQLAGIIYLHRISDPRLSGTALRYLRVFKQLCGAENFSSVTLVTNHWSSHISESKGLSRTEELVKTGEFWGSMVERGSRVMRHDANRQSALQIVSDLVDRKSRIILVIQRQLIDQKRNIDDTDAGQTFCTELTAELEKYKRRLGDCNEDIKFAIEEKDIKWQEEILKECAKSRAEIKKTYVEMQLLKTNVRKELIIERRSYEQNLTELDDEMRTAIKEKNEQWQKDIEEKTSHYRDKIATTDINIEALKTNFDNRRTTYRVRNIPRGYDQQALYTGLDTALCISQIDGLSIHSLATNTEGRQTATLSFNTKLSHLVLQEPINCVVDLSTKNQERYQITLRRSDSTVSDIIAIDKDFIGFTPLSQSPGGEDTIDCIAIHGWGSHAFGGFKSSNGHYMWLRDSLPVDVPALKVWVYGYNSKLTEEGSIANIDDHAETFRRLLRSFRKGSKARPMIFIAHSLGGLLLKEALVAMKSSSNDIDQQNVMATYGALFFGVPSQGMRTEALAAMVGDLPQKFDLVMLDRDLGSRLRSKKHQEFCKAFNFKDSKIVSFYETQKTPTVQEDPQTKQWSRTGPLKLLVDMASATVGRQWESGPEFIVPIHENHSSMVKFEEFDPAGYPIVLNVLEEFVKLANTTVAARFEPSSSVVENSDKEHGEQ